MRRHLCAAFFSGKIGHSERSEESRPRHEENEILRCAQNDGIAYLPENMAAHPSSCAAFFSGKIGHSERSEESRPRREENEILRCAQNDGIAYLPENMAAHRHLSLSTYFSLLGRMSQIQRQPFRHRRTAK